MSEKYNEKILRTLTTVFSNRSPVEVQAWLVTGYLVEVIYYAKIGTLVHSRPSASLREALEDLALRAYKSPNVYIEKAKTLREELDHLPEEFWDQEVPLNNFNHLKKKA